MSTPIDALAKKRDHAADVLNKPILALSYQAEIDSLLDPPVQPTEPLFAWIFEHTHKPPNRFILVMPDEYATAYRDTCIRQIPVYAHPPVQPTESLSQRLNKAGFTRRKVPDDE